MTSYYTADLHTTEDAQHLAGMPQLAGNGHTIDIDGTIITISRDALDVLADLPDDYDGHYDGQYIWIGGIDHAVQPGAAMMLAELESITARRADLDARRDELVRALMGTSVARSRIAEAARVKEARLYQIRDDRR